MQNWKKTVRVSAQITRECVAIPSTHTHKLKWVQILPLASCNVPVIEKYIQIETIMTDFYGSSSRICDHIYAYCCYFIFLSHSIAKQNLNCVGELPFFGIVPCKDTRFRHISNGADSFIHASNVIWIYVFQVYVHVVVVVVLARIIIINNLPWFDLPKGILPDAALSAHRTQINVCTEIGVWNGILRIGWYYPYYHHHHHRHHHRRFSYIWCICGSHAVMILQLLLLLLLPFPCTTTDLRIKLFSNQFDKLRTSLGAHFADEKTFIL